MWRAGQDLARDLCRGWVWGPRAWGHGRTREAPAPQVLLTTGTHCGTIETTGYDCLACCLAQVRAMCWAAHKRAVGHGTHGDCAWRPRGWTFGRGPIILLRLQSCPVQNWFFHCLMVKYLCPFYLSSMTSLDFS